MYSLSMLGPPLGLHRICTGAREVSYIEEDLVVFMRSGMADVRNGETTSRRLLPEGGQPLPRGKTVN